MIKETKQLAWNKIKPILKERVRQILDDSGIVGVIRIAYHNYAVHLWRVLNETSEEDWDKVIRATSVWYEKTEMANPDVLLKVADAVVKTIREVSSKEV
jgi:hypothetical protein